uniref:Uncharacterized protein n=1 Tax=Tanacetum cinerariifolium TaxID=118510 RepID=A0A6L2J5V5_TANCI|nr:hypothetical protein [Tanacetum cinerariifolium]
MLRSGMVLMKGYISFNDQVSIVKKCRELGLSDGGFYQPGYRDGTKLHLEIMCLVMVKKQYETRIHILEEKIPKAYAGQVIPSMSPDICIVCRR